MNQGKSDTGSTPLYIAAQFGNLDVVRYLAGDAHAAVNQGRTDDGCTPLFIAAEKGNLDVVRYLAGDAHADVNQRRADIVSQKKYNDVRPVIKERDSSVARMTRGQRILRLVKLIEILDRQEHRRARTINPIAERAHRYRGVVSSEQMQAAVIGLVGSHSSMSHKCKSMLTQAFRVYLMLLRAAERRRHS